MTKIPRITHEEFDAEVMEAMKPQPVPGGMPTDINTPIAQLLAEVKAQRGQK